MIWTKEFWQGAGERALKTFSQSFVAVVVATVGADAIGVTAGLEDVSWATAASVAGLATFLSVATSVGNSDFTAGRVPGKHVAVPDGDGEHRAEGGSSLETP